MTDWPVACLLCGEDDCPGVADAELCDWYGGLEAVVWAPGRLVRNGQVRRVEDVVDDL